MSNRQISVLIVGVGIGFFACYMYQKRRAAI